MKNREKHSPKAKERRRTWWQKTCINVYFPKQHIGLKQNQKLHDLVLFKQVSKHGKFHYSLFMEEAVATVIFQRKRNPMEKKLQITDLKQIPSFTISFQLFFKGFPFGMKILSWDNIILGRDGGHVLAIQIEALMEKTSHSINNWQTIILQ